MEDYYQHILLQFIPLLVISLAVGVQPILLAREKGRKVVLWSVLGFLPVINFFCIWYFVGASNLKQEQLLNIILAKLQE